MTVKAEDDGDFRLLRRSPFGWRTEDKHVALLEAKGASKLSKSTETKSRQSSQTKILHNAWARLSLHRGQTKTSGSKGGELSCEP